MPKLVEVRLEMAKAMATQEEKYVCVLSKQHNPGHELAPVKLPQAEKDITQALAGGEKQQVDYPGASAHVEEHDEYFDCHSSPANHSVEKTVAQKGIQTRSSLHRPKKSTF